MSVRRFFIILALGIAAIFLQSAVLSELPVIPNLLLVIAIFVALQEMSVAGASLCFLLGLESDLYTGVVLGPAAGAYVCLFGLLVLLSQRIFVEGVFVEAVVTAMLTVFYLVILLVLMPEVWLTMLPMRAALNFGGIGGGTAITPLLIAKEAFATGVAAPIIFYALRWVWGASGSAGRKLGEIF